MPLAREAISEGERAAFQMPDSATFPVKKEAPVAFVLGRLPICIRVAVNGVMLIVFAVEATPFQ